MKKKAHGLCLMILMFLTFISCLHYCPVFADDDYRQMQPVFDGKDGLVPVLKLSECIGYNQTFAPNEYSHTGFSSTKVLSVTEVWAACKRKDLAPSEINRIITIRLWYCENSKDALLYPYLPDDRVSIFGALNVPRWPSTSEVGDKTLWFGNEAILFTKGKVLVAIEINSTILIKDRLYLEKIARLIEKKL